MPNKAARGRAEDIRACIGCNQACIGHFHKGYPISCIQNPVTGRELRFGTMHAAQRRRKVMVVGGGPAGMKAAVVAAQRGHEVTLFEAERRLGGQALLAQMLPGRAEFGGLVTNLLARAQDQECRCRPARVSMPPPSPRAPPMSSWWPRARSPIGPHLRERASCRSSTPGRCCAVRRGLAVRCGHRLARRLDRDRHRRAACAERGSGAPCGQWHRGRGDAALLCARSGLGLFAAAWRDRHPYMRLYGSDSDSVYLQHITSAEAIVIEGIQSLVLCTGHEPICDLGDALDRAPSKSASSGMQPRRAPPRRRSTRDCRSASRSEAPCYLSTSSCMVSELMTRRSLLRSTAP